jgi:predicted ester cyclase
MTPEDNKATVRAIFAANDAAQNMSALPESAGPGYTVHFPGMPPMDAAGMAAMGNAFYAAFSNMSHTLHDVVADDDHVAVRLTISGTHDSPFQTPQGTIPPSGAQLSLDALNFFRMAEGRPVEHWIQFDLMTLMQQIAPGHG